MPPYNMSPFAIYWVTAAYRVTFSSVVSRIPSTFDDWSYLAGRVCTSSRCLAVDNERHLPPETSLSWRSIAEVMSVLKRMIHFRLHNKECGVQFHDSGLQLDRKTLYRPSVHNIDWRWLFSLGSFWKNIRMCHSECVASEASIELMQEWTDWAIRWNWENTLWWKMMVYYT